jgi:hypothetical protein
VKQNLGNEFCIDDDDDEEEDHNNEWIRSTFYPHASSLRSFFSSLSGISSFQFHHFFFSFFFFVFNFDKIYAMLLNYSIIIIVFGEKKIIFWWKISYFDFWLILGFWMKNEKNHNLNLNVRLTSLLWKQLKWTRVWAKKEKQKSNHSPICCLKCCHV